jgi:hypothetical protein
MSHFYALIARVGRKFALSIFAGGSAFLVTVAGLWITARVSAETGEIVADVVKAYLLAAPVLAGAYAASNSYVEGQHAKAGTATAKAPPSRASGSIPPNDGVI